MDRWPSAHLIGCLKDSAKSKTGQLLGRADRLVNQLRGCFHRQEDGLGLVVERDETVSGIPFDDVRKSHDGEKPGDVFIFLV